MSFFALEYLWLFGVFAMAIGVMAVGAYRKQEALKEWVSASILSDLLPAHYWERQLWRYLIWGLAIFLLILGILRPQWGSNEEVQVHKGMDILVAIDTSLSMAAEDVKPNRLERAKQETRHLLSQLSGDRVGLIPFAGNAFTHCPLSSDYAAVALFLDDIDFGMLSRAGTQLAAVFEVALHRFKSQSGSHQALIIFTDGENFGAGIDPYLSRAQKQGLRIFTIGVGSSDGELIPLYKESKGGKKEQLGYKKDRDGQLVLSVLDEQGLRRIAEKSNGEYFHSNQNQWIAEALYRELSSIEKRDLESQIQSKKIDRYHGFIILAICLLLLDYRLYLSQPRLVLGVIFMLLLNSPVMALTWGEYQDYKAAQSAYESQHYEAASKGFTNVYIQSPSEQETKSLLQSMGNSYFQQGEYLVAVEAYERALGIDSMDPRLWYNIGHSYAQAGRRDKAIESYKEALKRDPSYLEAKKALEWVLLQEAEASQSQSEQDSDEESESDESQGDNGASDAGESEMEEASSPIDDENQGMPVSPQVLEQVEKEESEARKRHPIKAKQQYRGAQDW